jgi:pimeloyl-ACP methyl ester carboxylesterase
LAIVLLLLVLGGGWVGLYLYTLDGYYMPKYAPMDINLPVIELGDDLIFYRNYGRNDTVLPVVLGVHDGPGLDMHSIRPLRGLQGRYRVVLYDQRGCGQSSRRPDRTYTPQMYIDELDSLYRRFAANAPVLVVAQGWGTQLVAMWLAAYPQHTPVGLVLFAPQGLQPTPPMPPLAQPDDWAARWTRLLIDFEQLHLHYKGDSLAGTDWAATARWRRLPPGALCAADSQRAGAVPVFRAGADAQVSLQAALWEPETHGLRTALAPGLAARTDLRVWLILGECDPAAQRWLAAGGAAHWPASATQQTLPGAGRYPLSEQPDSAVARVRAIADQWLLPAMPRR